MSEIRILPPEVVSRIAAGEVVERPASIVKELAENALDAHASDVEIEVEDGGRRRVVVRDNGRGMGPEDLELAFRSHATSKLRDEDLDGGLFGVATLGFRGEALPSIASVAEVEVVSRPPRAEHAFRYRPGGEEPAPAAAPPGTTVEVANLFHGVPARRKFLRAASTELQHVVRQVTRLALGFPGVRFRLSTGTRTSLDLAPASGLRERIGQVVGRDTAGRLLEVREGSEGDTLVLRGFVGPPDLRRGDAREQHLFVNGRWVRDRMLSHALRSAYEGFLVPGCQPVGWLFLDVDPGSVDANVHPTKAEVRFRETGSVHPAVRRAVRRALEAQPHRQPTEGGAVPDEPAEAASTRDRLAPPRPGLPGGAGGRAGRPEPGPEEALEAGRERIREAARSFFDKRGAQQRTFGFPSDTGRGSSPGTGDLPGVSRGGDGDSAGRGDRPAPDGGGRSAEGHAPGAGCRAFQVLDSYIVRDDGDGLVLIDQHALHEKVLYEEILRRLRDGELARQRLLVPEVVELPAEHLPLADAARSLLARVGYDLEVFGDREVAVQAVPRLFEGVRSPAGAGEFVREVFRWLEEEGTTGAAAEEEGAVLARPYRRLASLLACKRAVKAGARLGAGEIDALLERADTAGDPRHCPHGRPTSVRIGARELEALFDRR